jgi:hypothetical protein
VKQIVLCLTLSLLAAPAVLLAQTVSSSFDSSPGVAAANGQATGSATPAAMTNKNVPPEPFSRLGLSVGIGIGGINLQAAVEANRYINIRGIGNYFTYNVNNIKVNGNNGSNGIDINGNLTFAEGGVAVDFYPWPNHGFRLSPGVTFYNQNGASATGQASAGTDITLGSDKYYSDPSNPFTMNANLALNTRKQAFSMTTGWGNMISRKGHHLSFPFEIGAIFTGAPTVGMSFTGTGCTDTTYTTCYNMATSSQVLSDINTQVAKYQKDLNALQVYPVMSVGVAYNFKIR